MEVCLEIQDFLIPFSKTIQINYPSIVQNTI